MTFEQGLATGYRIASPRFLNLLFKQTNPGKFAITNLYGSRINTYEYKVMAFNEEGNDWLVHPEDQKLIDFEVKLKKELNER